MLDAGLILSRFLHYIAALSLFGAALYPLYTFRGRLDAFASEKVGLEQWLRTFLFCAVILVLFSGLGWFEFTTGTMADSADAMMKPRVLMSMMMGTDFGPLWAVRLGLAAVLAVLLIRWPGKQSLWLVPLLAALLLASLAGTGHARVTEGWGGTVHIVSDAVHLLAAGLWFGGLWPLGFLVFRSLTSGSDRQNNLAMGVMLRRFSGVATIAVAILVASGLINSWFLVGSISALFASAYGWLLAAKVALFGLMALLASVNRFWITPQLDRAPSASTGVWLRRLRWHVVAEQGLGIVVLAVVSVLGTLQPTISP